MPDATWRMTWPITDMTTPLNDLLGWAMQDIARELRARVLRQSAPVEWRISRNGAGIVLVAEVPVQTPDPGDDEQHLDARHRRTSQRARLRREDVHELLRLGETSESIAARFGVTHEAVERHRYARTTQTQEATA